MVNSMLNIACVLGLGSISIIFVWVGTVIFNRVRTALKKIWFPKV